MSKLSFDDLISKQYLARHSVELPGVGTIEIMQLSATEAQAIAADLEGLDGDELELYISQKAAKFVKGDDATDSEVEALRGGHTATTISKIFTAGLESAAPIIGDMEQAEKN